MLHGRRYAQELDDELRFHLELEIEHNIARGMSPVEARRVAHTSFGGVQRYREETREARGFATLDAVARDLRLTFRRLRRSPGFTVGVVATLALGLGSAAGIGALVYGVMLRPLPFPDSDRIARVSLATPGLGLTTTEHSSGTFVYFQERARSFTMLGAYLENEGIAITDGDAPERVNGAIVTPNLFGMLGAEPALGRLFSEEDARADPVPILISHDLWQRRYGGDSAIIGSFIEVNRGRREVLGVLPRGFEFPSRAAAVYYPEHIEATRADLGNRYLTVMGRLRPGVSVADAQAELDLLVSRLHQRYPEMSAEAVRGAGLRAVVETWRDAIAAPVRGELTLLAIMVAVVLLMATTSVATLYLLRAERLRGEIAVSRAIGASRSALARRFVVEGTVLGLIAGITALPIVAVAVSTKFGFSAGQIPRLHDVALTPGLIGALGGIAVVIGVLLGLVALARSGGGSAGAAQTLRGETRSTGGRGWRRAQESLVAVQIALALALLLGAGLMGESLTRLRSVDVGFDARNGSKFTLVVPFSAYPSFQRATAFHLEVRDRLRAIPGVTAATVAMQFPLTPQLLSWQPRIEASRDGREPAQASVTANVVPPEFFEVMGISLRAGRTFAPGDLIHPSPGVVISASLARELFGAADPIGREVRLAASKRYPAYRVVGVSGDVYGDRIANGALRVLYFPLLADLPPTARDTVRIPLVPAGMHFVVRSELPLATLTPAFRRIVSSIDPRVPMWEVRRLDDIVFAATARARLTMLLLTIAAAATLLLGAIGLYSVIAYAVSGRAREFAVRLALGATPRGIMRLVFRDGAIVAAFGMAAGFAVSLAGSRFLRNVLYEVSATDPRIYAVAGLVALLAILAAMYPPARRAGDGDPSRALRDS
jgi:putative ABC transport system permease protein